MGAPKLKPFPKKENSEEAKQLNEKDKKDIELLKQVINEKLKNPETARKAAKILEEIINK